VVSQAIKIMLLVLISTACWLAVPGLSALSQTPIQSNPPESISHAIQAETLYQEAIKLFEEKKYGLAYRRLSQAVRLWQQGRQEEQARQALLDMADRFDKVYRWEDAIRCYHQLHRLPANPEQVKLRVLISLGRLHARFHQWPLASEYYEQALGLARKIKDWFGQEITLIQLAGVYAEQGEIKQALTHLRQAQRLRLPEGSETTRAEKLRVSGWVDRAQGHVVQARQAFEQAIELYRKAGDQPSEAQSLCSLSEVCVMLGQTEVALQSAERARALARNLGVSELQWRAWLAQGRAQRALGQTENARKSYASSCGFVEKQQLTQVSADALKISFLVERQAPYRELIGLLFEQRDVEEAFNYAQMARARATFDLLALDQSDEATAEPPESFEGIKQRIEQLRTDLRSPDLLDQQRAARQAELGKLEARQEEMHSMDRRTWFTRTVALKQVQEKMLRPDEVLLEFFLGEPRSYVWLVSAQEVKWATLPGRKTLEEKVSQYLDEITRKPDNRRLEWAIGKERKLAAELFEVLLGPLAERLAPDQRLIIAPDGLLYYLPFETLVRSGRWLVEDHEINYVPSASVLGLLKSSNQNKAVSDQMDLLVFGAPVFGAPTAARGAGKKGAGPEEVMWGIFFPGGLPPLPNAGREARYISECFPAERRRVYLGAEAVEEKIKRESLGQYRRLHFATHSLINEQFPARSCVVLTLDGDPEEDGLLDLDEIMELKLNCDVVVLSACQTGRGQLVMGEGVVGFTRAFLYAGARSVAVSLWNVSDLSTAQLMKRFYQHLAAGLGPTAALRQAKIETLQSGKAERHPYYWAPFVLVGATN
jgi:CHAT domain-containing protein